jgi:EPS-associated MarR family transcriptional regulator
MSEEIHYKVLKLIEQSPKVTQREIASELGVSLGKANYCLQELIKKGWVKASNFKNSNNKIAYAYLLTPKGIENKGVITLNFLKYKMTEYELLKEEIKRLKQEVGSI